MLAASFGTTSPIQLHGPKTPTVLSPRISKTLVFTRVFQLHRDKTPHVVPRMFRRVGPKLLVGPKPSLWRFAPRISERQTHSATISRLAHTPAPSLDHTTARIQRRLFYNYCSSTLRVESVGGNKLRTVAASGDATSQTLLGFLQSSVAREDGDRSTLHDLLAALERLGFQAVHRVGGVERQMR